MAFPVSRADIGSRPTPLERRPALADDLGVSELLVKRDDKTGEPYGGNKVRKLEFLLGEALAAGCRRVFTSGGVGSNHVLATCTYARAVGLAPVATQFPQPPTAHVRENLRAIAATEPNLTLAGSELRLPLHLLKARLTARLDESLYYIPPGGSSPVGAFGFVEAAEELARQVDTGDYPEPDVVVVPASSGGTLAGLRVGIDRTELDTRVVGVRVIERYVLNRLSVARLARKTASLLEDDHRRDYGRSDVELLSGFLGDGYGVPTDRGETLREMAADHGLTLDPTYTAKAVAAVADRFDGETVCYWHTLSESRPQTLSPEEARERLPRGYRQFLDREQPASRG
jgi:D-cysteine desulfhydrase